MKKYFKLRKKIIKTNKIGLLMKAARNASEIDNMQSWNTFNTMYANFISKSLSIYPKSNYLKFDQIYRK